MTHSLTVALVGTGSMGQHHARAIRQVSSAKLVAVCDRDIARAETIATDDPACAAYDDLSTMLATIRPDVVHICTPPATHASIADIALTAGAHVYVEKPFTETVAEAEELLTLASQLRLKVCAGHQVLFERPTHLCRSLIPRIGEIRHVDSYFAFRPTHPKDGRRQRTSAEQLLDILPHPAYLLLDFLADRSDAALPTVDAVRVDETGSLQAIVSTAHATGVLVVTLEGRPVESYVRVVGTRGTLMCDYVRGIVVPSIGVGTAVEKLLDPFARATSLTVGSIGSMARRVLHRRWAYPGLAELFVAFYEHIRTDGPAPVTPESIRWTVQVCERVARCLEPATSTDIRTPSSHLQPTVAVTGGTGMLGQAVVRYLLGRGVTPLVLARRPPLDRDREPGVSYKVVDIADPESIALPPTIQCVVHCAAEVHGGWDAHQRNSVDATRTLLDVMKAHGIRRLVHVSSLAVIDPTAPQPLSEASPLDADPRRRGPYVWGKAESEAIVSAAPKSHGIDVRVIRPGPLISARRFDPPGRLGRAITAQWFIAVGNHRSTIPLCDVDRAGAIVGWTALHFEQALPLLHALDPQPVTRQALVEQLRHNRPGTRVVWLPGPFLSVLALVALLAQRLLRPSRPPVDLRAAFGSELYDTGLVASIDADVRSRTRLSS